MANTRVAPLDVAAPTAPTVTTAAQVRNGVAIEWTSGSDDREVQRYRVLRDGAVVATVDAELLRYVDRAVPAGTPHVYTVRSVDGAGNESSPGPSAAAVAGSPVLTSFDDFSLADGAAWSNAWATEDLAPSKVDVLAGEGRLTVGPGSGTFARGKLVEPARQADGTLLASYRWGPGNAVAKLSFWLRASGGWKTASAPVNGYAVNLASNSTGATLTRMTGGTSGSLGSAANAQVTTAGVKQWVRFQVVGSTVRARFWRDGQVEPTTWRASFTSSAVTAPGRVYLAGYGSPKTARTVHVDDVALSAS